MKDTRRYYHVNGTDFQIVPIDDFGTRNTFTDCILIVQSKTEYHEYALSFAEAYEEIANRAEVVKEFTSFGREV